MRRQPPLSNAWVRDVMLAFFPEKHKIRRIFAPAPQADSSPEHMLALRALACSQSPVGGGRVTAVFGHFCAKEYDVKMKSFRGDV